MKKFVKLTERDLSRIVKRVVKEEEETGGGYEYFKNKLIKIEDEYDQVMAALQSLSKLILNTEKELYKDTSLSEDEKDKLIDKMGFYEYADEKIQDLLYSLED